MIILPFPGTGETPGCGWGVGTRPVPVTTPPGIGLTVITPGVGLSGGTIGQLGISQHVGSLGSGTRVHPGCMLVYAAHLQ